MNEKTSYRTKICFCLCVVLAALAPDGEAAPFGRTVADDLCDIGDSATTCTVTTSHTIDTPALLEFNDLVLQSGVVLTHSSNSGVSAGDATLGVKNVWLAISAENLTLQAGAAIDVTKKGYSGGVGGAGDDGNDGLGPGRGYRGLDWYGGTGGGFGGVGGKAARTTQGLGWASGGQPYGSGTDVEYLGSGGGSDAQYGVILDGGDGGGLVVLTVNDTLTVDGAIRADGQNGSGSAQCAAAGGSGGGIAIEAWTWAGSGTVAALGGDGAYSGGQVYSGAGGGGRISVRYFEKTFTGTVSAAGGTSPGPAGTEGSPGTVYEEEVGGLTVSTGVTITLSGDETYRWLEVTGGTLNIDSDVTAVEFVSVSRGSLNVLAGEALTAADLNLSGGRVNNLGTVSITSDVDVTGAAVYNGFLLVEGILRIAAGGLLSHSANTGVGEAEAGLGVKTHWLDITAASLTVESGGSIDVDGKGYSGGVGGAGDFGNHGRGPGAGYQGIDWFGGTGAGFGGTGGKGARTTQGLGWPDGGTPYGAENDVVYLGSGGGSDAQYGILHDGGDGGGLVVLDIADTLTVDGSITADGGDGSGSGQCASGGGSGGGIRITAGLWAGSGSLLARGGDCAYSGGQVYSGGGGGGRIFVSHSVKTFTGLVSTAGGSCAGPAGTGGSAGSGTDTALLNELVRASSGTASCPACLDGIEPEPALIPGYPRFTLATPDLYEDYVTLEGLSAAGIEMPIRTVLKALDPSAVRALNPDGGGDRPPSGYWEYSLAGHDGTTSVDGTLGPGEKITRIWRFADEGGGAFDFWVDVVRAGARQGEPIGRFHHRAGPGARRDSADGDPRALVLDDGTAEIHGGATSGSFILAARFTAPPGEVLQSVSFHTSGWAAGDEAEVIFYEDPEGAAKGPEPSMEVRRWTVVLGSGGFQEVPVDSLALNGGHHSGAAFYLAVANTAERSYTLGVDTDGPRRGTSYISEDGGATFEPISTIPLLDGNAMIRAHTAPAGACFVEGATKQRIR